MTSRAKDEDTRSIEVMVEIRAPAQAVWKALTEARELANWFPATAQVDKPGVGGTVTFSWGHDISWQTRIDLAQPGKHLRWLDDPQPDSDTRFAVDILLTTRDASTVVRLVHSGFGKDDDWNEQYEGTKAGWTFFLFGLRHYLEIHGGRARHLVSRRLRLAGVRSGVWQRILKSPEGIAVPGQSPLAAGGWRSSTTRS